ncbi:MAG: hypothetical protein R3B72_49870 [Polyangiaceae bacterium]
MNYSDLGALVLGAATLLPACLPASHETNPTEETVDDGIALAVDDAHVYWTETYAVWRRSRVGGERELLTDRLYVPSAITQDAHAVYIGAHGIDVAEEDAGFEPGVIVRIDKATGVLTQLATGQFEPMAITLTERGLYWLNAATPTPGGNVGNPSVMHLSSGDARPVQIAGHQALASGLMTGEDGRVYWTSTCSSYVESCKDVSGDWMQHRRLRAAEGTTVSTLLGDTTAVEVAFMQGEPNAPWFVTPEGFTRWPASASDADRLLPLQEGGPLVRRVGDLLVTIRETLQDVVIDDPEEGRSHASEVTSVELFVSDGTRVARARNWPRGGAGMVQDIRGDDESVFILFEYGLREVALTDLRASLVESVGE